VDDPELLDLVELEVRELLKSYQFPATTFRWSGLGADALEDKNAEQGEQAVLKLMAEVDRYIPQPVRDKDKPFLMPIEDVFSISGRGTVVTAGLSGDREGGRGDRDRGSEGTTKTVVTGVEMFRKLLDQGRRATISGAAARRWPRGRGAGPGAGQAGSITRTPTSRPRPIS